MRERYPFSEDVVDYPAKWTTIEGGIQYLREVFVWDMVYSDLKLTATMNWECKEAPNVGEVAV